MGLIRDLPHAVADTSLFCRCAETGTLRVLATYLGDSVLIVRDVERELKHRKTKPQHAGLQDLDNMEPPFPAAEALDLSAEQTRNAKIIAEKWAKRAAAQGKPTRDERANYGEIATVFAAEERGLPVLMDEGQGKTFAASKGLTVYTSADLLAEIVAAGKVGEKRGRLTYQRVYNGTKQQFGAAVADARNNGA